MPDTATAIPVGTQPRLGVHVLGPGYGESIVLELPDGNVGVIDCFARRHAPNPVLGFLESRYPGLARLAFLALTHPHADHCLRAADLLERFVPGSVWLFPPFPASNICEYYKALKKHQTCDAVEKALDLPAGSTALSLLQVEDWVTRRRKAGIRCFRALDGGGEPGVLPGAEFVNGCVRIDFLTPTDDRKFDYVRTVKEAAVRLLEPSIPSEALAGLRSLHHNAASGAMLVEWGQTRILLMADAEQELWEDRLTPAVPARLKGAVHFLTVSHHGSANGFHRQLYDLVADPEVTIAVVTPFARNTGLPSPTGIRAIRPCVKELYCTDRNSAVRSSGMNWE